MMMMIVTDPHSDDDVNTLYSVYTVYYSNYFTLLKTQSQSDIVEI